MSAVALGNYDLPERNRRAAETIQSYAVAHAGTDAVIGLGGFLPIPGAAPASVVAALLVQIPMYKSLARELSSIYQRPQDAITRRYLRGGITLDSALTVSADVVGHGVSELAEQFGRAFLAEIGSELIREMATGFAMSFIPVIGGLVSTGLDVAVAATMTWRVGTMIAIYYQNGGRWVEDRKETYERSKDLTGGISPEMVRRVDLDDIPHRVPEVHEHLVEEAVRFIMNLRRANPDVGVATLHEILRDNGFPDDVAEEAIKRAMKKS